MIKPSDQNFPIIRYDAKATPYQWGLSHGEEFRAGIKELVEIRRGLMLKKSPHLKDHLVSLARQQEVVSLRYDPALFSEYEGIAKGADISLAELTILNNYTDFRDIDLPDQGCSTVYFKQQQQASVGQTWDMHHSARYYLCLIEVPEKEDSPAALVLSLVGCLGLMGINQHGLFLGVNNITTKKAQAGLVWPLLVRHILKQKEYQTAQELLKKAPVTSGHNYLLAQNFKATHLEVSPELSEQVALMEAQDNGSIFHTNHCLGSDHQKREVPLSATSTSQERFALLTKKTPKLADFNDLIALLQDHEGEPKSLCMHPLSHDDDPSSTCGGGVFSMNENKLFFWRGCPTHDQDYKNVHYQLNAQSAPYYFQRKEK